MRSDLALAALASAAVPGMKPVAVAGLTVAGDDEPDHQQAIVEDATGRRWLVRSPLSAVAGARLQRNDDLVRSLGRHLPFKVPAPVGYAAVGTGGRAAVYPYVEGLALDFAQLPVGPGLASAVGRAAAAIHNIPRAAFEERDVPTFDASGCRQRLIAEVDRAAETGRVPTGLLTRWEEAFEAAPLWQFATTPVHGGFRGASVLVAFADDDVSSGRVVAITDWEEAMVGDPAGDLVDICTNADPAAWESVLDSYALARSQRPDPYLHARARLMAETGRLRGLARSVSEGHDEVTRRVVEALRRLDRETEDADSLVPATARGAGAPVSAAGPGAAVWTGGTVGREGAEDEDGVADLDTPGADEQGPGVDPSEEDRGGQVASSTDDTVSIPVVTDDQTAGAPAGEGPADPSSQDVAPVRPGAAAEDRELGADLDADERLHELYGMPSDEGSPER